MTLKSFENLIAWQKAQELAVVIYRTFENCRLFTFNDQIIRAAISISNNIAEGFDSSSKIEFRKYLNYAYRSCSEVRSMVHLGRRFHIVSDSDTVLLLEQCNEVSKILMGLHKKLSNDIENGRTKSRNFED